MIALFIYEFRQIWRHSLTWVLCCLMVFSVLFFYAQLPPVKVKTGYPNQEENFELSYLFTLLDDNYTVSPGNAQALNASKALITQARYKNQASELIMDPQQLPGPASLTYQLFQFTQSGLLILASLAFGLIFYGQIRAPAQRRISILKVILARSLALTITLSLIFILPKIITMAVSAMNYGSLGLNLTVPFNPRAGSALYYHEEMGSTVTLSIFRTILASSLISLGKAYGLAFFYELAQIFVWTSLGVLLADLITRKFLILGGVSLLFWGAKSLVFLPGDQGLSSFLFFAYNDALRDTLGSPMMMRGLTLKETPFDYSLGVILLFLSGILFLYLTQLRYQSKLSFKGRGGSDDEDL